MRFSPGETLQIPSPIDVHIHLREPGGEEKETIDTGTFAAIAGGYQAVFDMPNNPRGQETWTEARLDEKYAIARHTSHTNIGFYAGVNLENPSFSEMPALVTKAAGLKLYMGKTTGNDVEYDLGYARPAIDEWITQARPSGAFPPILLHAREGIGSEVAEYIASQDYPVHWCHIASESEARDSTMLTTKYPGYFTSGVTPHHLTMTTRNADFQQGWNGARMQPPLGDEIDAMALLDAYNRGNIQILETDHAPHTFSDKMNAETKNPEGNTEDGCTTCFGVSGIEFVLPIMMSLVQRRIIEFERLVDSLYDQPIRMLRLGIGNAALTATTTIRVAPRTIDADELMGKSENTPYIGWTGWANVISIEKDGKAIEPFMDLSQRHNRQVEILKAQY